MKKLKVVYSTESPVKPLENMENSCKTGCVCPPGTTHKCTDRRAIPGSISFVPSVAGLILAGEVIKDLIAEKNSFLLTVRYNSIMHEPLKVQRRLLYL